MNQTSPLDKKNNQEISSSPSESEKEDLDKRPESERPGIERVEKEKAIEEERTPERKIRVEKRREGEIPKPAPPLVSAKPLSAVKSKTYQEIENILAENLWNVYQNMDEVHKRIFKQQGEEVASKIEKLISEIKIKVKEIFRLIKEWLEIIPKVNKFFLEQEAKIKTDKIVAIARQKKGEKDFKY